MRGGGRSPSRAIEVIIREPGPYTVAIQMTPHRHHYVPVPSSILPIGTAALALAIFIIDTETDLEIAVAVFYVAVVLLSMRFLRRRGVILVSAGCVLLTVLSYFLTPTGSPQAGSINCLISLSAIAVTTYLALKIEAAQAVALEAQAQLAHVARVMTLGELTTSIAHEINQPLAAIVTSGSASLHWLAGELPNIGKARQAIDRMIDDANRASQVIGRIRGLAKRAPPRKEILSIRETISEAIALTQREIEQRLVSLHVQIDDSLPDVLGDRIQLQQVLLNLIVNAIDSLAAASAEARDLFITAGLSAANEIAVTVRDTGGGLGSRAPEQMFEPFHSTKSDGLGIGLTISRTIIEAHGGHIWATANAPCGATFGFTLPIAPGAAT